MYLKLQSESLDIVEQRDHFMFLRRKKKKIFEDGPFVRDIVLLLRNQLKHFHHSADKVDRNVEDQCFIGWQ
jgi:hypothetical protein